MQNTNGSNVLIVDDDPVNCHLLSNILQEEGYLTDIADSGEVALASVKGSLPDIILLDVMMPGINGFDVARMLKEDSSSSGIPIIMVTALDDTKSRELGLIQGVEEYITKPINPSELKIRVRNLLRLKLANDILKDHNAVLKKEVDQRSKELLHSFEEALYMLMRAAEYRDDETGAHIRRISYYTKHLSKELGMNDEYCNTIFLASPMHDIGKIGIPDAILLKPGPLVTEEWAMMKRHTTIGAEILAGGSSPYVRMGQEIALSHHERWDGSGYPNKLIGKDIPLAARIMAVCDVYDALRSDRPYKPAYEHDKCVEIIRNGDERIKRSHFDPEIIDVFLAKHKAFEDIYQTISD